MNQNFQLFNRALWLMRRRKSAAHFNAHSIIHQIAEDIIMQRLDVLDKTFDHVLILGGATGMIGTHPKLRHCLFADIAQARLPTVKHRICMDEEFFPFQHHSLDAIISVMTMHNVNDLAGALIQMQRALKPDGLLLIVTSGAQSLHELRDVFARTEQNIKGGITPRIHPFLETRDAGALLQRAGFNLPVVDSEKFTLSYENMQGLLKELRYSGEANCLYERSKNMETKAFFNSLSAQYQARYSDTEQRIICTAELLTMTAWKPHESQQKPLARGSATMHLGDVL